MAAQPRIFLPERHVEPLTIEPCAPELEAALALSLEVATHALTVHEHAVALALPDLGAIDLPDAAASLDPALLQPLAPLYLAHELEHAGFLAAAEQIAGLFAGGAVIEDVGTAAEGIMAFWRGRRARLTASERAQILEQVFEDRYFYPLLQQLCSALVAISDNAGVADLHEEAGLEQASAALLEFLAERAPGMLTFAARDLVTAIDAALRFLRERRLQTAFGVRDLWSLVATAASTQGKSQREVRTRVEMARAGAEVVAWLIAARGRSRPDTLDPQTQRIASAAQRWLLAHQTSATMPLRIAATGVPALA